MRNISNPVQYELNSEPDHFTIKLPLKKNAIFCILVGYSNGDIGGYHREAGEESYFDGVCIGAFEVEFGFDQLNRFAVSNSREIMSNGWAWSAARKFVNEMEL